MKFEFPIDRITFRQLVGPSMLTAVLAGFLGPLAATLWLLFTRLGDGGMGAAVGAVGLFAFAGAIIAIPVGLLALLLVGIPITLMMTRQVCEHPIWAILTGIIAGILLGGAAGLILFGKDESVALASISGAVFGCVWIVVARRNIVPFPADRAN